MAHPMNHMRDHMVQKSRVASLTGGHSEGGKDMSKSPEGQLKRVSEGRACGGKVMGKKSGGRLDRPKRASGGKVQAFAKGGKVKGTTVNVIVSPSGGDKGPMPVPVPVGAGAPPPMPPHPPMAGPMPPPGGPPGMMPPPGPPIRKNGGRIGFAKGGAVPKGSASESGPTWKEGRRNGTPVQHTDGKSDTKDIVRPRQVTFKTGGKVEAGKSMGPKMTAGAGSEMGREQKMRAYGGK